MSASGATNTRSTSARRLEIREPASVPRDDGDDVVVRLAPRLVEAAEHVDGLGIDADLLDRLSYRRGFGTLVRLDPTAR